MLTSSLSPLNNAKHIPIIIRASRKFGVKKTEVQDLSEHLTIHYQRVMEETQDRYIEMVEVCGKEYIDKMIQGLKHWVEAEKNDYLSWGIVHMNKSANGSGS